MVCSRERCVTRFCRSNGSNVRIIYAIRSMAIHTVDRELLNALFFKNSVSRKVRRVCRSIFLKFAILRHRDIRVKHESNLKPSVFKQNPNSGWKHGNTVKRFPSFRFDYTLRKSRGRSSPICLVSRLQTVTTR